MEKPMRAVIRGTGMYVPANIVDNDRMSRLMDTSDEWIRRRTGIERRRFADLDQGSSDLAIPAAEAAIRDAGIDRHEIDYVVFATMTPDHYFPGAGTMLQHKLGLGNVPALDIRQQCAGFLYGMQVADALLRSGQHRNVLLVGAEVHGGFMPWSWDVAFATSDRPISEEEYANNTRFRDRIVLFGDGAGAVVLGAEENEASPRGILDVLVHSDGSFTDKMWVKAGGSRYKPYFSREMIDRGDTVPIVEGREVFRAAVTLMPESVETVLARNGLGIGDLGLLIMHQANLRINEVVQKRLGLPDEKVYNNIQQYGNTTAATLPMAFHEAREARGLKPGDLVAFTAVGSGLNWGAALYRM
jgi:3-oxoacyl-[acyl-carrier-protein] synthase-3